MAVQCFDSSALARGTSVGKEQTANSLQTLLDTADFHEGCLSLPGFSAVVPRARRVRVAYLDEQGEPQSVEASGWYARILQHEIDHLRGTLYIDRMESRTFTSLDNWSRFWKGKPVREVIEGLSNPLGPIG
jgi:peptide deformylase